MWLQLAILGAVIGANNFSAALALGALGQARRRWRIAGTFAAFEFTVPLLGIWLGQATAEFVAGRADWLGPALLAGLGLWTLFETTRDTRDREALGAWLTGWRELVLLAAGLSVDNLVVGVSLGLEGIPPLAMAATIMGFSVTFTLIGLELGGRVRHSYETASELVSGGLLDRKSVV